MSGTVTRIIINFQFEALHCWPDCNIPSKKYLRFVHRHVFHVEMKKEVLHDDRDVEFILFKEKVTDWVKKSWDKKNLGPFSCEQLAKILMRDWDCCYVKIMEDGENGAEVERHQELSPINRTKKHLLWLPFRSWFFKKMDER